eukprot:scaffold175333_cov19-Tisochrysis_lutea.AAC.1
MGGKQVSAGGQEATHISKTHAPLGSAVGTFAKQAPQANQVTTQNKREHDKLGEPIESKAACNIVSQHAHLRRRLVAGTAAATAAGGAAAAVIA